MSGLILASGSPRRAEMMGRITKDYEILVPDIDEESVPGESPEEMARRLAVEKAEAAIVNSGGRLPVLAADTIVVHDKVLGKPSDSEEARQMLAELADDSHFVITGVAVIDPLTGRSASFIEKTEVFFGPISSEEIDAYVSTGEPMDKAGAYGIQGEAGRFITGIKGCFYNVMGFPLHRIYTKLRELDII